MSQKADNWLMRDKLYSDFLDAIRFDDLAHVKFLVKNWNNTYDFSLLGFVSSVQMLKFLIEQFPNTVSKQVIGSHHPLDVVQWCVKNQPDLVDTLTFFDETEWNVGNFSKAVALLPLISHHKILRLLTYAVRHGEWRAIKQIWAFKLKEWSNNRCIPRELAIFVSINVQMSRKRHCKDYYCMFKQNASRFAKRMMILDMTNVVIAFQNLSLPALLTCCLLEKLDEPFTNCIAWHWIYLVAETVHKHQGGKNICLVHSD